MINKTEKPKVFGSLAKATVYNLSHTPIYELIKEKVSDEQIKKWSKIDRLLKDKHTPERKLNSVDISFYDFVKGFSEAISKEVSFEKALAVKGINKYETCIISGIRKYQQDLGIRPNLNQVKYNTIKRLLNKKSE